ncbi:MAG: glycosyltransferase family 2 protein [Ginsengibacter sp.]
MFVIKIIFWLSLFVVIYSYVLYGFLVWVMIFVRNLFFGTTGRVFDSNFLPNVSLVIATYNEEVIIEKKVLNTFELEYPTDKLDIYFVTDGSTDGTTNILKSYPRLKVLHREGRKGKVAAMNHAMEYVKTPYVVFCDANTFLNKECIREIIKHYNYADIGAVAGEKKVIDPSGNNSAASSGEGIYWKYESLLKKLDAEYYTVVGAAGELFSMRTDLYRPVNNNILLDDFMLSMNICKEGYRVMYEPKAFAMEAPSMSMKEEEKRKIRISAGGFQSMSMLMDLFNIFKYGKLSFQYISHRVLRWAVCPFLLPVILIANIILSIFSGNIVYNTLLATQLFFYITAFTGWILAQKNIKLKILYVPYYFLFMNVALYLGFFKFLNKQQTVLWDKAARKPI